MEIFVFLCKLKVSSCIFKLYLWKAFKSGFFRQKMSSFGKSLLVYVLHVDSGRFSFHLVSVLLREIDNEKMFLCLKMTFSLHWTHAKMGSEYAESIRKWLFLTLSHCENGLNLLCVNAEMTSPFWLSQPRMVLNTHYRYCISIFRDPVLLTPGSKIRDRKKSGSGIRDEHPGNLVSVFWVKIT